MRRECTIKVHGATDLATIEVLGDLTASAEKAMHAAYEDACGYNTQNILLKFDDSSRINSAGIAIIIDLTIKRREEERKLFITGVSRHFRKIFDLVGLTKHAKIVESAEEVGKS